MYQTYNLIEKLFDTIQRFKKLNYFEIKYCFIPAEIYREIKKELEKSNIFYDFSTRNMFDTNESFIFYGILIIRFDNYLKVMNDKQLLIDNGSNLRQYFDLLTDDEFDIKNIIE